VSNPELTAIIPVAKMAGKLFNLELLLRRCHSLGIEVVIVHDEQDLDTGVDLERIVKSVNSDLVSVITKTVYSPGKARNLGISRATGDWICFWDSDDNPVPENFLSMLRQAESQTTDTEIPKLTSDGCPEFGVSPSKENQFRVSLFQSIEWVKIKFFLQKLICPMELFFDMKKLFTNMFVAISGS
jgi:glycosyltransferase involved in cell wall biosynthesis